MAKVASVITSRLEPMEPQTSLLAFLKRHEGKRLDKRFWSGLLVQMFESLI